jgi:hypothetical protein
MDKDGKHGVHSVSIQLKHDREKVPFLMDTEWDLNGNNGNSELQTYPQRKYLLSSHSAKRTTRQRTQQQQ